nr:putative toxin-antitoxin system toxin component, PIN family [Parabacteroides goldsteinii]
MRRKNNLKVVIDTNIWISFLIGKKLSGLQSLLSSGKVQLVLCKELVEEIHEVTQRPKLAKYFPQADVEQLLSFMNVIGKWYIPCKIGTTCRDPKDDYLLALAEEAKADYLLTGDNDLLVLKRIGKTEIITVSLFEELLFRMK